MICLVRFRELNSQDKNFSLTILKYKFSQVEFCKIDFNSLHLPFEQSKGSFQLTV